MDRPPLQRVLPILVVMSMFGALLAVPAGASGGASTVATARAAARGRGPLSRPGELIVRQRRTAGSTGLARALDRADVRATAALGGGLALVRVTPGQEVAAAKRLAADPAIAYAEPNYVRTASSHDVAETNWSVQSTQAPALWAGTPSLTGAGVRVAILDSGVDNTHTQLQANTVRGFDAYDGSGTSNDACGHGTAVAGVVAAAHDGEETVGVAPDATIVPVRVLHFDKNYGVCGGDDASIIRGIRWAADPQRGDADVINMSLSGPQTSLALRDAVAYAVGQGVLVVAASGNSGDRTVNYPAAYPSVISVGGLQRTADEIRLWPHASFGSVDIAAPAKAVPVLIARQMQDDPSQIARQCANGRWCADGTSFAAPHVAGVAALLYQQHPNLADMSPGARLRRLQQWILGTAPRVDRRPAGVDLKTGHGMPDAMRASGASTDSDATLLTWQSSRRVLAPARGMAATPARVAMSLVATTGTGAPLGGELVDFETPTGGSLSATADRTNSRGAAWTTLRSPAGGRVARVTATFGEQRPLPVAVYVLHRDDNVPGVAPRATSFGGSLNVAVDVDDVYRFKLYESETLRATVSSVNRTREQVVLYLHRGSTHDVTDPYRAPLREDAGYGDDVQRLSRTVHSDGIRYLDVYGFGTYRLKWWILVPGAVRSAAAAPQVFSPDADGFRDRTRLSWVVARRGAVTLSIRNAAGTLVRRVAFGTQAAGAKHFRWNGRTGSGRLVRDGQYRVGLRWSNGHGRVWTTSTKVTVAR